jgi:hypothetical protein
MTPGNGIASSRAGSGRWGCAYYLFLPYGSFSGMPPDGVLPEIIELPGHAWFIGVQYHPELKPKPFYPNSISAGGKTSG